MAGSSIPDETPDRRAVRWDAVAAVIASLVGFLALLIAAYTAYVQRYTANIQLQQVRAQVWPYLLGANSDNRQEYMWINKGVGPALVKSLRVTVGGRPQHDWKAVMRSLRLDPINYGQSTFNRNVISAGETLDWLKFKDHSDFRRFRAAAQQIGLGYKVCYCSTLGECWITDATAGHGNRRSQVERCPAVPESEQFDD